jgi:IS5 family transposase
VKHPFRVIKNKFGLQKARYQGNKKNDHKLKLLFSLANLYKIRQGMPATE